MRILLLMLISFQASAFSRHFTTMECTVGVSNKDKFEVTTSNSRVDITVKKGKVNYRIHIFDIDNPSENNDFLKIFDGTYTHTDFLRCEKVTNGSK